MKQLITHSIGLTKKELLTAVEIYVLAELGKSIKATDLTIIPFSDEVYQFSYENIVANKSQAERA